MTGRATCAFCSILSGETKADIVVESDDAIAIRDIHPQAPHHFLVIPREHVPTLNEVSPQLLGSLFAVVQRLAKEQGFSERGYRTVINAHREGGQTVWHLHIHVLAGRPMRWPPG